MAGITKIFIFFILLSSIQCNKIEDPFYKYELAIEKISPTGGLAGTEITITGTGFSTVIKENIVKFNGKEADVTKSTPTLLMAKAPAGGTTGAVTVTVNGNTVEGPVYTYLAPDQPQIISVSPEVGWDYTINSVIINGKNFGNDQNKVKVNFDNIAASIQSFSSAKLIVSPPKHTAGKVDVVVKVDGASSNAATYIYQQKPEIFGVSVDDFKGKKYYFISVKNLAKKDIKNKLQVNAREVKVDSIFRRGSSEYNMAPAGEKMITEINVGGNDVTLDFLVTANGIASNTFQFVKRPQILETTSLSLYYPAKKKTGPGDTLEISGIFFGIRQGGATVELWDSISTGKHYTPDPEIVSWSNEKIIAIIPSYSLTSSKQIMKLIVKGNNKEAATYLAYETQSQTRGEEVEYSGTSSIPARAGLAAAGAGNKIVFAGGSDPYSGTANIYDINTGTWTTWQLSEPRVGLAAAAAGNKIVFAGGYNGNSVSNAVDIYDVSTGKWTTARLTEARRNLAGAAAGNKILFGGGYSNSGFSNTVDMYDVITGKWSESHLSQGRYELSAAGTGDKVVFGGGHGSGPPSNLVDIYDVKTGDWTTAKLSEPKYWHTAAAAGNKIIFAGGYTGGNQLTSKMVDIYDISTNKWSTAQLSKGRRNLAAVGLGNKILVGGGVAGDVQSNSSSKIVDVYDVKTGKWTVMELSTGRMNLAAAGSGKKILFGGGAVSSYSNSSGYSVPSSVVDIYDIK